MNTAYVKIWGELVGAVAWDDSTGLATFEFAPGFSQWGWDLSPLQMPVYNAGRTYSFPALRKKSDASPDTFKGLPGLLADSLPDTYGHELINLWLTSQGRAPGSMNPVELLCFIGNRGMGALEFEPAMQKESKRASIVEIDSLVATAQQMLFDKQRFQTRLQQDEEKAITDILRIGTSAGGARPKAVIAWNPDTGEVRSGQTVAPKGFEQWIIKLDGLSNIQLGSTLGYGRVEMAYYLMATACGIDMMPSRLLKENHRAHFMTKRFDREAGNARHHIQTFCALKHFDYNAVNSFSYEQLFQTMRELKLPYPSAEQMFRRMVFNVLARNCDDHTKNFAFRLKKEGQWELAPAYDISYAYNPQNQWVSHHALSVNGKRNDITLKDLLLVGDMIRNKKAANIIGEISDTISQWEKFAGETGVSDELFERIDKNLIRL